MPVFTVAEITITNRGYFLICHIEFELYIRLLHNSKKQAIRKSFEMLRDCGVLVEYREGKIVIGKAFWRATETSCNLLKLGTVTSTLDLTIY